jgi:protein deglycase
MTKKSLIVLAEGFEEVEAITPIDVLRRCEVDVTVAGLKSEVVPGTHNVEIKTDILFEEYDDLPDALLLPGGMPGAENLASSVKLKDLIVKMNSSGKIIAAICASPVVVLEPSGILKARKATCYPGMESGFSPEVRVSKEDVAEDGNLITSRGPGTAFAFAFKVAERLVGEAKSGMVSSQMLYLG